MICEYDIRLKSCPFCHKPAWLVHIDFSDDTTWYRPECSECKCGWKENYEIKEEAIKEWNNRS